MNANPITAHYARGDMNTSRCVPDEEKRCITDVQFHLLNCVIAVLRSWMNPRAREFRHINNDIVVEGTAVTIQVMAF